MANQKQQRPGKGESNKHLEQSEQPMRKPGSQSDVEREESSDRNSGRDSGSRDRSSVSSSDDSSVISNDEEVELEVEDLDDDSEENQVTGRHPSQSARDLK